MRSCAERHVQSIVELGHLDPAHCFILVLHQYAKESFECTPEIYGVSYMDSNLTKMQFPQLYKRGGSKAELWSGASDHLCCLFLEEDS